MEPMRMLALPTSPFAARVAIQVYEKGIRLPVERPAKGAPPGMPAELNPFRLSPVLVVGETTLIESGAIAEYLEDIYPAPSLRGADAITAAKVRALVRAIDLYLFPAISALRTLPAPSATASAAAAGSRTNERPGLAEAITLLHQVIDRLQPLFFGGRGYACGPGLTLADCALVPAVFHLERFLARSGQASGFAGRPLLQEWWDTVTGHASGARVLAQLEAAVNRPA